jgi:formylglycine-generating enzyme required for sulfatase activity
LADPATVSGFRLDKYLVTVGRFAEFVAAWNNGSGWLPAAGSGKHVYLNGGQGLVNVGAMDAGGGDVYESGWVASGDGNIAPTSSNLSCFYFGTWDLAANLPINCVNWYEAYAFCIWDGGFLPSAAEWEYAAAGGSQQRLYPWGSTPPGMANQYAIYGCYYPSISNACTGPEVPVAPVGTATLGGGLWGQLDLAGEVSNIVLDWAAAYVDPCSDCAYLTATNYRALGGGTFGELVLPPMLSIVPDERNDDVGLRCARAP